MEFSPYLQAIQKVAGQTISEKYQSLNRISRKIIVDCKNSNSPIEVHPSEELAEPLIPLVELNIAKILKKPEGVMKALKSDDQMVFNFALKTKWFFNGSIKSHPNAHHFRDHIFPYISLNNRFRLIKVLATNLTPDHSEISEEFYLTLREMYGEHQAQPFLKNCSESFVQDIIINHPIKFDMKELKHLFRNYPDVIIKYFELCVSYNDTHVKNVYPELKTYKNFLPRLLKKKRSKKFVELIKMSESSPLEIKLSRKCTNIFLQNEMNILMEKPGLFMPILSLEKAMDKLQRSKFETIFKNLFPKKIEEFNFKNLFGYLEYIPQDQKVPLMLSIFEQVYKVSLLDCDDKITPEVLKLLPASERIKQARKKFETNRNWYTSTSDFEKSWVCYLPVEESIPAIKKQISKTTDHCKRIDLVNYMIYTCKINNDTNALLDVLKYATTKHKNEEGWSLLDFLERLPVDFEVQYLPQEHWEVLNKFIDLCHDKRKIYPYETQFHDIVIYGIHHDLINNLSITKKIDLLTEGNIDGREEKWNILKETPEFEKLCIEEFMKSIPKVFPKVHEDYTFSWPEVLYSFVKAIYDFNKRNSKAKNKVGNIMIKSNPLFSDEVQKLVSGQIQSQEYFPKIKRLKLLLKINEPDLYDLWVDEEDKQTGVEATEALWVLRMNPQKILDNWENYYEKCKNSIYRESGQHFMQISRWYQDIPIKFVEKSLKSISDDKDSHSVAVLASLIERPVFEKFIKKLTSNFGDVEDDTNKHLTKYIISKSLKALNPPASLEFISQLCEGNDVEIIKKCLTNVGRRISVDKLLPFCQELMNRQEPIQRLNIELLRDIVTTEQLRNILINLWREEKNASVRSFLIRNILDTFVTQPCLETWKMLNECFDGLTTIDRGVLKYIRKINRVPNKYIADYVKQLLIVFKKIGDPENSFGSEGVWYNIQNLLQDLPDNLANLFSEEQHEEILKTYLVDLSLPKEVLWAAQRYLVDCYILPAKDKFDARLKFFLNLFVKILQNEWDVYRSDDPPSSYPAHYFVQRLVTNVVLNPYSPEKLKLINAILDAFLSVLKPQEAPEFYCKFTFAALHDDKTSPKEFGQKISKIVSPLIDNFSDASISVIARYLFNLIFYFYYEFEADGHLDIIESLLESSHDDTTLLAANLLLWQNWELKNFLRFWKIIEVLRKHKNSAVVSCANLAINGYNF